LFHSTIGTKDIEEYSLKVKRIDLIQKEKEFKWGTKVFPVIMDGLMGKKEYKVTGFGYSFHPAPLEIIIKTSIKSTDKDADKLAAKIETTIKEFLTSKELEDVVGNEPYEIKVRSKDMKIIN
jgi:hypothetical protein